MRRIAVLFCAVSVLALPASLSGCGPQSGSVSGPYGSGAGGRTLGG